MYGTCTILRRWVAFDRRRSSSLILANVQHLRKPEFLASLSALVEDLSDKATYAFTSMPMINCENINVLAESIIL
jgi:hypothetical protein